MQCFRHVVSGLTPREPGFSPRTARPGFVVGSGSWVFPRKRQFFPSQVLIQQSSILLRLSVADTVILAVESIVT